MIELEGLNLRVKETAFKLIIAYIVDELFHAQCILT